MEYSIRYSTNAEQSLIDIFDYIRNVLCNRYALISVIEGIFETINSLRFFPKKHGLCKERFLSERNIRSTRFKNYKILYFVDDAAMVVLINNIYYIKRDPRKIIGN